MWLEAVCGYVPILSLYANIHSRNLVNKIGRDGKEGGGRRIENATRKTQVFHFSLPLNHPK